MATSWIWVRRWGVWHEQRAHDFPSLRWLNPLTGITSRKA